MENFKVGDLKELIKILSDDTEVVIVNSYTSTEPHIELIKEIKPVGKTYYKITL